MYKKQHKILLQSLSSFLAAVSICYIIIVITT